MEDQLVKTARTLAFEWHRDQLYGVDPYTFHLMDVVRGLREFNYATPVYLASGYVHDSIEDIGDVTKLVIANCLNAEVADHADAVSGEGHNRKEKMRSTIQKLIAFPPAIPLKMVDRLVNMRNCKKTQNYGLFAMYWKELPHYREVFEPTNKEIWQLLCDLGK